MGFGRFKLGDAQSPLQFRLVIRVDALHQGVDLGARHLRSASGYT